MIEAARGQIHTAILMIIEGQLQAFQRFSISELVLKTVESCFASLNYYENGSKMATRMVGGGQIWVVDEDGARG
jgi:hypothetical protein